MTPKEYEQIVSEIAKSIFERVESLNPEHVRYGKKNHWLGDSGYQHQIDVSVQGSRDIIFVECKCWSRNVPTEAVLTFFGRVYDIRSKIDKSIHPVIVTKIGFQKGAKLLAKYYDIDLQVISSASVFGFMYKKLLLIQSAPATATVSAVDPVVAISNVKNGKT